MDLRVLWFLWLSGAFFLGTSVFATIMLSTFWAEPGPSGESHATSLLVGKELTWTIFTAPAPFDDDVGIRQRMAIDSWLRLAPRPKVILLGQHSSMGAVAASNWPHVSVEDDIDFTFSGKPMFHVMVQRALRTLSDVVVLIEPDLVLLPHVVPALESLHGLNHDWLITALPRNVPYFPYSLQGHWIHAGRSQVDDLEVLAYAKKNGIWDSCDSSQFWAWNGNGQPLHAGIMPPFVYTQGQHNHWLLTEALASKYRHVIDASEVISVFRTSHGMIKPNSTKSLPSDDEHSTTQSREVSGNLYLASAYGSFHFRSFKFSDISLKLIKCARSEPKKFCLANTSQLPCFCSPLKPRPVPGHKLAKSRRDESWPLNYHNSPWLQDPGGTLRDPASNPGYGEEANSLPDWYSWLEKMTSLLGNVRGTSTVGRKLGSDCACNPPPSDYETVCLKSKQVVLDISKEVPPSLVWILPKVANMDKVVILAVVGSSYRDMLMNWACRLKHLNITNFLVSALDDDIYDFASLQGLPVFKSRLDMEVSRDDCHFGSECFQRVTKMKSRTVLQILQLGYHVLFSDVDVYWFKNPTKELMSFGPGHLSAQSDQWNSTEPLNEPRRLNSGFYFAWSDKRMVAAFQEIVRHAAASDKSEQPSFYDVLCGYGGKYRVGNNTCFQPTFNLTVHFLDPERYPNGAYRGLWEEPDVRGVCEAQGCRVLHNNWIPGRRRKLERQFAAGLWDYDTRTRMCIRSWY